MSKIYSFNRNDKELFEVEFASLPPHALELVRGETRSRHRAAGHGPG
jgi:hypothetical protein